MDYFNQEGQIAPTTLSFKRASGAPICIDFFDGFRSCRDDGRYQDGLIKTSKIIVIKIRKTRERIARYPLTRLGFLSINAQNFRVDTSFDEFFISKFQISIVIGTLRHISWVCTDSILSTACDFKDRS